MAYIVRDVWKPFMAEALQNTQNIISLGLVQEDNTSPITKEGQYLNIPVQSPITTVSSPSDITSTTTLTPKQAEQYQEIGVIVHKGEAYKLPGINKIETGYDALAPVATSLTKVVIDTIQNSLVSVTKGAFGTGGVLASSHTYSPASETLDAEAIIDGVQSVYGENMNDMEFMIVHSAKYAELDKANLLAYKSAGTVGENIYYTGTIPTFLGKRVLINDTLCEPFTDGASTKYPTYIGMGQPWYLGYQRNLDVYTDFDMLTGRGTDKLVWYTDYLPHLRGVSYTSGGASPSGSTLETTTNWTKVAQDYNIKLMRIETL